MSLDNLKGAWSQFKIINNLDSLGEQDIWAAIEIETQSSYSLTKRRLAIDSFICLILTFCCQAG